MEPANHLRTDDFTRTRWSLVQQLRAPRPGEAREALLELAVRYWYPVYAYVRRCGHASEIAQDITRAFFQHLAAEPGDGALPQGRFRDWLLWRLNTFLAGDWQELTGNDAIVIAPALEDLERRNRDDRTAAGSPEQAFQRGFALEVLARGFKRLQSEAGQTGHLDMYEALEPYLAHDPLPGQYEEIGQRLGIRPLALVLALKRLRQRFRELVQQELIGTVASPEALDGEQRALFAVLGGGTQA